MPIEPEVDSTIVAPGASLPDCSARLMQYKATRSFILPVGFADSSLRNNFRSVSVLNLGSEMSGVSWMQSRNVQGLRFFSIRLESATVACKDSGKINLHPLACVQRNFGHQKLITFHF